MRTDLLLAAAAAWAVPVPLGADVVRLANGSVLEGVVRDGGDGETIVLEMRIGTGRIRRAQVLAIERKPYAPAPPSDPVSPPGAAKEAAAPAAAEPPAAEAAAGSPAEIALFEGEPPPAGLSGGPGASRGGAAAPASAKAGPPPAPPGAADIRQWILAAVGPDTDAAEAARRQLADLPDDAFRAGALRALRHTDPAVRRASALALRGRKDAAAIPDLAMRSIVEPDRLVLRTVAETLGALGDPRGRAAAYFAGKLDSDDRATRARTAEVLGWTGDVRWVPVLIRRYQILWGCTNRGNYVLSNQLGYIPDYDIELATGVAIPDPKVGIVQDGVVLDAMVLKVEEEGWWYERQVIHDSLVRLAGADAGPRPADWKRWLAANPKKP